MELFTFTPGGHETIDGFNQRLATFAAGQQVTGARTSVIGGTLVLSLTLADDLPAENLLRPFVSLIGKTGLLTLETALTAILDQIKAEDKPAQNDDDEDVMSVPLECRCFDAPHEPTGQQGYAVFLIGVGQLEITGE